jgi:hypothetical protein
LIELSCRPAIPGQVSNEWFVEEKWEIDDPLWRAALQVIEDLQKTAQEGLLSIDFENSYMFHTAFIHGHAHWPPLHLPESEIDHTTEERKFHGSVQPAVFAGPRICLMKIVA